MSTSGSAPGKTKKASPKVPKMAEQSSEWRRETSNPIQDGSCSSWVSSYFDVPPKSSELRGVHVNHSDWGWNVGMEGFAIL